MTRRIEPQHMSGQIVPIGRDQLLPVSLQQEGLWFLDQLMPGLPVYNVASPSRIRGSLDAAALQRAFTELVARHESLRTRFGSEHGVPNQVIDPAGLVPLPVTDLSGLSDPVRARRAEDLAIAAIGRPFDLAAGPLFRTSLLRLSSDDHILLINAHHIVIDGWSHSILTKELGALYNAFRMGKPSPLPPLSVQYADYAAWQRQWLTGEEWARQLAYWTERLAGLPSLDFPTDYPRPADRTWAGSYFGHLMPAELNRAVEALALAQGVPLLAALMAGFLVVLARYTGQEDLAVGSVFGGRTRPEIEPIIGFFVNTLVLRTSAAGDPSFRELLTRAGDTAFGALLHQDVPFGKVVDALQPERDPSQNPLFQVSFALETGSAAVGGFHLSDLEIEPVFLTTGHSRFDLGVTAKQERDGRLGLWIEYSTELFSRSRMVRLAEHFQAVMEQAVTNPELRISEFRLLTPRERERLLLEWNPASWPHPTEGLLLHEIVEQQAAARPDHVAVQFEGLKLSYHELDERANRLGQLLRRRGVGPGSIVAVLLDRGLDLAVSQLGILKAGGAWLPLDPAHPRNRLVYQLDDAKVAAVISKRELAAGLPEGTVDCICLDDTATRRLLGQQLTMPPPGTVSPEDLAYVIYTSGSTGKPKGVMISHRAVVNFTSTCRDMFRITPADRILQFANPTFDVSIFDIYGALCSGATLIAAARETLHDPPALTELLRSAQITVADIPPSVLALLDPEIPSDLRLLWVGMEPFAGEVVNRWNTPERDFHHGYGPTEVTVGCIDYRCPHTPLLASPAIGHAMANHRAYVLDRNLHLVPIGINGELYVAGAGLARGYLNRPGLTAERFLPDPFAERSGERMYRTGDLARWRDDGNLEFIGRVDTQIKINGLRIEPGEIEHVLCRNSAVKQAAVVAHTPPGTNYAQLAAYVVAADPGAPPSDQELRLHTASDLPLHMVPSSFTFLDSLPFNSSGKIDRRSLPKPTVSTSTPRPPTTPSERETAEIWRRILNLPGQQISANDGFFALGGSSIQLIQLLARLRERFGVGLDMREMFLGPTIERLASVIDQRRAADTVGPAPGGGSNADETARSLIPIKPDGSLPPFFCVHAVGGSTVPYVPLAHLLPAARPFYGLEAPGLHGGAPIDQLPAMAENYLRVLRTVQPAGPYHLGGWSMGGAIAFEMACQLRDHGEEVASLVMFDTAVPPGLVELPNRTALLASFLEDLAGLQGKQPPPLDQQKLAELPAEEQAGALLRVAEEAELIPGGVRDELHARIPVFIANATAVLRYQPRRFDGRVIMLGASPAGEDYGPGWSELATEVVRYTVPGTHYSMLQPPFVATLAATLERCLR